MYHSILYILNVLDIAIKLIYGQFADYSINPFVIALFCGVGKPSCLDTYLQKLT